MFSRKADKRPREDVAAVLLRYTGRSGALPPALHRSPRVVQDLLRDKVVIVSLRPRGIHPVVFASQSTSRELLMRLDGDGLVWQLAGPSLWCYAVLHGMTQLPRDR